MKEPNEHDTPATAGSDTNEMTPEELSEYAINWIADNAPDAVLKYLDETAEKESAYIISLEQGMEDLEAQNACLTAELAAARDALGQIEALAVATAHIETSQEFCEIARVALLK